MHNAGLKDNKLPYEQSERLVGLQPTPARVMGFNACGIKLPTDTCYIFHFLFAKLLLEKIRGKLKRTWILN